MTDMEQNKKTLPTVLALAYLGDARHSLYVRKMLIERGLCKSGDLNRASLDYVTAQRQAQMLDRIYPHFTEGERAVFKRASNSKHLNKPKHATGSDYRAATGFEAVIGMLYWYGDEERIAFLLDTAHSDIDLTENDLNGDIKNDSED